jgi:hypothetical protein
MRAVFIRAATRKLNDRKLTGLSPAPLSVYCWIARSHRRLFNGAIAKAVLADVEAAGGLEGTEEEAQVMKLRLTVHEAIALPRLMIDSHA